MLHGKESGNLKEIILENNLECCVVGNEMKRSKNKKKWKSKTKYLKKYNVKILKRIRKLKRYEERS